MNSCQHDTHSNTNCLLKVPIFNHLPIEQLEKILPLIRSRKYKKDEIIYRPQEKAERLYIIRSGKVKIYKLAENAKEQILRLLLPGDFTGELNIFTDSLQESFAQALEDSEVCTIAKYQMDDLIINYPSIALALLEELTTRLEHSDKQTALIGAENVETRLAKYITELQNGSDNLLTITLPMTKKNLASYLGTTPETLSRKLTKFEKQGYITLINNRKIKIKNRDALQKLQT